MAAKKTGKNKFQEIVKLFQKLDNAIDGFLFSPAETYSWKELLTSRVFINIILVSFVMVSTMSVSNYDLLSIIMCASMCNAFITEYVCIYSMIRGKKHAKHMLEIFSRMYDMPDSDFIPIQEAVGKKVDKVHRVSIFLLRFLPPFLYINVFFNTIVVGLVGSFILPDSIYPKYTLPAPYYLPFKEQQTPLAFFVTMAVIIKGTVDLVAFVSFTACFIFTVFLHYLTYLDIILSLIKLMRQEILKKNKQFHIKIWMKPIVDMTNEVNTAINYLNDMLAETFLSLELETLSILFIFGLIVFVIKQQYMFIIAMVPCEIAVFFIFCYVNEKFLEKFSDISYELYSLPWYNLSVKDMNQVLIAMNANTIQDGFSAIFNNLTLEQFSTVMKTAYSYFLILKDLVVA